MRTETEKPKLGGTFKAREQAFCSPCDNADLDLILSRSSSKAGTKPKAVSGGCSRDTRPAAGRHELAGAKPERFKDSGEEHLPSPAKG